DLFRVDDCLSTRLRSAELCAVPPPDRPGNGTYWVGPHQCKPEFWTQLSVKWRLMTRLLGLGLVAGKLLRRWTEAGGGELPGGRMPLSPRCSRGVLPGDRQQLQRGDGPAACCIAVALEPRPSSRQLRSCTTQATQSLTAKSPIKLSTARSLALANAKWPERSTQDYALGSPGFVVGRTVECRATPRGPSRAAAPAAAPASAAFGRS